MSHRISSFGFVKKSGDTMSGNLGMAPTKTVDGRDVSEIPLGDYIHIVDKKAQNTPGGDFTSGAWQTRDVTDILSDVGGHASIASNQITLAAGTYECRISCPAYEVLSHQARLYNITDAAVVLTGSSEYTAALVSCSWIVGRFTLAASKVLEIQHRCSSTLSGDGFGLAANFTDEIYTIAEFRKAA